MGLPAKSGVSGSLVLVVPNVMGIGIWWVFCWHISPPKKIKQKGYIFPAQNYKNGFLKKLLFGN